MMRHVAALPVDRRNDLGDARPFQPPASRGLQTSARSNRLAAGKVSPPLCGVRPVALQTAVISIADFVPSMKLLNIFGLIEPRSLICRYLSRMSHTVSGVERW